MNSLGRMPVFAFLVLLALLCWSVPSVAIPPGKAQIDGYPRLLQITVIHTSDPARADSLLADRIDSEAIGPAVRRVRATARPGVDTHSYQVQVLEGESARIHLHYKESGVRLLWVEETTGTGELVPAVDLATEEYIEGFLARAQLSGEMVTLHLEAYGPAAQGTAYPAHVTHVIDTTVTGRPGQWMDLGGSLQGITGVAGPNSYQVDHGQANRVRILARVDVL